MVKKKLNFKKRSLSSKLVFTNSCRLKPTQLQEQCRKSYAENRKKYNDFFLECLEDIEALQPNGFSCIQAHRYFIVGVLPQHCTVPDPLSKKERKRVEKILAQ